jgi:hypothetical protein
VAEQSCTWTIQDGVELIIVSLPMGRSELQTVANLLQSFLN